MALEEHLAPVVEAYLKGERAREHTTISRTSLMYRLSSIDAQPHRVMFFFSSLLQRANFSFPLWWVAH